MKIRALRGHVLIEPEKKTEATVGGIYVPESAQKDIFRGKVLSVGDPIPLDTGVNITSPVKEGDLVIHRKYGGEEVEVDRKEYLLVKFEDLIALIEQ